MQNTEKNINVYKESIIKRVFQHSHRNFNQLLTTFRPTKENIIPNSLFILYKHLRLEFNASVIIRRKPNTNIKKNTTIEQFLAINNL